MGNRAETTRKEKAILKFIEDQVMENGYPPSVREIGKAIGLSSTATVHAYLSKLEKQGFIKKEGKKVLLAAGDTFRAGAIEQLSEWARRIGVEIVTKAAGSDPSSVMFDAVNKAKQENYDVLLCDTAGRLQNKVNLMAELSKINRVIEREAPGEPTETLLVIDATTGQNGMTQAKVFSETTNVSGVILTKLDGTAKGGIVLAIRNELGIPIKFIGLGEGLDDLEVFDIESYLYGLFADFFND